MLAKFGSDPLRLTRGSMVMELGINWAVDDPGLESAIIVAKVYCGFHVDIGGRRWFLGVKDGRMNEELRMD